MAKVPSVGTRVVGSQLRVSASDIRPQQTPLPRGASTQGLDAGARALTALGGTLQKTSRLLAEAGAVEQHKDDLHQVRQHVTEYDRSNLDATYGKLGPGRPGELPAPNVFQQAVGGYRDLHGDAFLAQKAGILTASGARRTEIRNKLDSSLHNAFDRLTEESAQSFRLKLENYNIAQKDFARASHNKAETSFLIDSYVQNFTAQLQDTGSFESALGETRHFIGKLSILALESAEAQAALPGKEGDRIREEIVRNTLDVAHFSVLDRLVAQRLTTDARVYLKTAHAEMTEKTRTAVLKSILVAERAAITGLADSVRELKVVLDAGGTANPQELQDTERALAVSSASAAGPLRRALTESKVDQKFLSTHRVKSISEQKRWLANAEARLLDPSITQTASEIRQIAKARAVLGNTQKVIKAGDGLALAASYGMIEPGELPTPNVFQQTATPEVAPLRMSDPASYRQRSQQATDASTTFGVYISPLTAAEVKSINDLVATGTQADGSTMSPENTAKVVAAMAVGLGREGAHALAAEAVNESDVAAFVIANAPDRPVKWIRDIILGQRTLAAVPDLKPSTEDLKASRETVLGNVFTAGTLGSLAGYEGAAVALYISRRGAEGKIAFDAGAYERALEEVTGGILEWGNQKLIAPFPGMTQTQLDAAMGALTQEALTTGSSNGLPPLHKDGTPFDVQDFDKPAFVTLTAGFFAGGTDSELVSVGLGRYQIFTPGSGYALTDDATAYEIDLRTLIDAGLIDKAPREPTPVIFQTDEGLVLRHSSNPAVTKALADHDAAVAERLKKKSDPVTLDNHQELVDIEEHLREIESQEFLREIGETVAEFDLVKPAPAEEPTVPVKPGAALLPGADPEATVAEAEPVPETVAQAPALAKLGIKWEEDVTIEEVAKFWGKVYQGESDPAKEATFIQNVNAFLDTASDDALKKIDTIRDTIAKVFPDDEGTNTPALTEAAIAIAIHESASFTETKQIGGGPGRGIFQVEWETAKSLLANSALIGPEAIKTLAKEGWNIAKEYTKAQINKFLENDVISTVFGVAQMLSGAKEKGELALLSTDPAEKEKTLLQTIASAVNPVSPANAHIKTDPKIAPLVAPDSRPHQNKEEALEGIEWVHKIWKAAVENATKLSKLDRLAVPPINRGREVLVAGAPTTTSAIAEGSLIDIAKGVAVDTASVALLPLFTDSSRMLITDIVAKNIFGIPMDRRTLTEKDLRRDNLGALRDLVRTARANGHMNSIEWSDYGTDRAGISIQGLIGGGGDTPRGIAMREKADAAYPKNLLGLARLGLMTMMDSKVDLALTIGGASVRVDKQGNTIVTDEYDAEEFIFGSASKGSYGMLRDFFQKYGWTLEGGTKKKIKWRVNLGKI
jgi:hypothetical protein